jgi:hypothetical protein
LKEIYSYDSITVEIRKRKENNEKSVTSSSEMIDLDVQRTFFETNIEESRSVIITIKYRQLEIY